MQRIAHTLVSHMRSIAIAIAIVTVAAGSSLLAPVRADAATGDASAAATVTPPADATLTPLPLRMARVGSARQMLIATGTRIGTTTGLLRMYDLVDGVWIEKLRVSARFGKRGLMDGTKRRAGNLTTPTGYWAMPDFTFGSNRYALAHSKMEYRRLTWNTWWSSRRGSTYNTWVRARSWTGEHIGGSPTAYEYAVSMGYNARPNYSLYGRGTGIFLHVRGSGLTAGCISITRADMIRVCRLLDKTKSPHFAVGTLQPGASTSIWAY